jgi:hypothetical protein
MGTKLARRRHRSDGPLRRSGLDLDRQRDGLHHPLCWRPRRPQRLGGRAAPLQRRAENSRPNKPTTCGKVERFQQTLKQWLGAPPARQPGPAPAAPGPVRGRLQPPAPPPVPARPGHPGRGLPGPSQSHSRHRPRPRHPRPRPARPHRHRRQGHLRVNGRLHHIGIGRTHARTPVRLLVHDLQVRVVNAATGELLRELIIDPARDYQPIHPRQAETTSPRTHTAGSGDADLLRDHTGGAEGI